MKIKKTKKKFYIKTWGCQMNNHDSDMIKSLLTQDEEYKNTEKPEKADLLILNTCSIREKAQEKLFHQLGRWKKIKEKNNNIIIAVGGCVAQQEGKNIFNRAKFVNIIFGPQTIHKLKKLINEISKKNPTLIDLKNNSLKKFNYPIKFKKNKKFSAFSTIIEGCNKFCSFCIVPYTRGKEISRNPINILNEIKNLANQGIREIILLGQNVNSYISSINKKKYNFTDLLYEIDKISGIYRIRFITSHPKDFSDNLIKAYQKIPKLVNFLHLPVQSGSDKILRLMKRGYTISKYINIIKKLKKIRPNINISSDFIIGFPGETEKDFQKTLNLIKKINFDHSFSFIYSPRPGTRAAKLIDNVSLKEKKIRLQIIQKKIKQNSLQWKRRMLGSTQSVLVEGYLEKDQKKLYGKTENNRTVIFEGNKNLIGNILKLEIIDINYHSYLKGIIL